MSSISVKPLTGLTSLSQYYTPHSSDRASIEYKRIVEAHSFVSRMLADSGFLHQLYSNITREELGTLQRFIISTPQQIFSSPEQGQGTVDDIEQLLDQLQRRLDGSLPKPKNSLQNELDSAEQNLHRTNNNREGLTALLGTESINEVNLQELVQLAFRDFNVFRQLGGEIQRFIQPLSQDNQNQIIQLALNEFDRNKSERAAAILIGFLSRCGKIDRNTVLEAVNSALRYNAGVATRAKDPVLAFVLKLPKGDDLKELLRGLNDNGFLYAVAGKKQVEGYLNS